MLPRTLHNIDSNIGNLNTKTLRVRLFDQQKLQWHRETAIIPPFVDVQQMRRLVHEKWHISFATAIYRSMHVAT